MFIYALYKEKPLMEEVPIKTEINDNEDRTSILQSHPIFLLLKKLIFDLKYLLCIYALLFILSVPSLDSLFVKNSIDLSQYEKYVSDCKNLVNYNREKIFNKRPFIAVCILALNMQDYIEKNLLSIINQSFQDFEIIIVNDGSDDGTENIIKKFQSDDKRIKLLTHNKKLGVYRSRIETIFNSRSEYILLMDPDDMYLNENLFQELYDYNIKNNLDIIEFSALHQIDGRDKIFSPKYHFYTHYHHFLDDIIYQPELSNILYYAPGTKNYSRTICRNIWNKMIRSEIYFQMSNYIGNDYYDEYIITADDMLMNIVLYQFSNNYSNINLLGYLYTRRNNSMSRGGGIEFEEIRAINYFLYLKYFYKLIQDFDKDINFLFYEMKNLQTKILRIKDNNITKYILNQQDFIEKILHENNISKEFETFLHNLSIYFQN